MFEIYNSAIGDVNTILELDDFDYSQPGNFGGIQSERKL